MTKIFTIIAILFLTSLNSFSVNTDSLAVNFSKSLIKYIKEKNNLGLIDLRVKKSEIDFLLEKHNVSGEKGLKIKSFLLEKYSEKALSVSMFKFVESFCKQIKDRKCKYKKLQFLKVENRTTLLNTIPIEVGELHVFYSYKKRIGKIIVEVILTESGWKILDDIYFANIN